MRPNSPTPGFTLVELLVVIAIIAILAGILLGVINAALTRADIGKARSQIADIVNAVKAFYGEYNLWPCLLEHQGQADRTYEGASQTNVIRMLRGIDSRINSKKIVFLDVPADALSDDGRYLDPWGNTYVIIMDTDFNNHCLLTSVGSGSPSGVVSGRQICVWSWGPNRGDTNSLIKSWE